MESPVDLVNLVASTAAKLPQLEDDAWLTFLPELLPALPSLIETDQLVILRGLHDYGAWRIDHADVSASKPVYEALGIAAAAVLLKPELDEITIRLTNPNSEIRELRIAFSHSWQSPFGLHQIPVLFEYLPAEVVRHPWFHKPLQNPDDYPRVLLTNADDMVVTEDERNDRDVLLGFGSAQGTARMIQLLLDISREANQCSEFALEAEPGFRGVATASAEIRLWLPGGDFYMDEYFV